MRTRLALMLCFFLTGLNLFGQKWMIPDKTIPEIKAICEPYFQSIRDTTPDSIFTREGSEYNQYMKFIDYWDARLGDKEKISDYSRSMKNSANHISTNIPVILDPWIELGPTNKTSSLVGIGPIEFIDIHPTATSKMLCGSLSGGLFYSTNAGVNWSNAGSDTKWITSGCAAAAFDPSDATGNSWYAITGGTNADGDASFFGFSGGVYHTTNAGATWNLIADASSFTCGPWMQVLQTKVLNTSNGLVWAIATSCGLYMVDMSNQVVYQVLPGYITDVDIRPGSTTVLYACQNFTATNSSASPASGIYQSTDGGTTWNLMTGLPTAMTDFAHLTIEVTPANSSKLYVKAVFNPRKTASSTAFGMYKTKIHLYDGTNWTTFSNLFTCDYGSGYAFTINPFDQNEFYMANSMGFSRVTISGTTLSVQNLSPFHPDVECIRYHPTVQNEVWESNHGGLERRNPTTGVWELRCNGLGVMMPFRMNNSVSTPDVLMMGAWHEGTNISTVPYSTALSTYPVWNHKAGGDGMQPLVDPINTQYQFASSQMANWRRSTNGGTSFSSMVLSGTTGSGPANQGFNSEGTLNQVTPNVIYVTAHNFSTPRKEEVYRNINRGVGTFEALSTFETQLAADFPGLTSYDIYSIISTNLSADYLCVVLNVNYVVGSVAYSETHIYRTRIATQSATTVQTSWTKLSLPRISDALNGVAFDVYNPDIMYITYRSSALLTNTGQGAQMVYRVDYTSSTPFTNSTCPSGLCADLTYNLPNTGMHGKPIAIEKGTNGNIYLATDMGVFFINNAYITDQTYWHQFGDVPHVGSQGIEINYRNNMIRSAVYGRGMWEHSLKCPDDGVLTLSGSQSGTVFYEAINEVTSTATVTASSVITYRAGTYVHLQPGFSSATNSRFHAFVHGCNQPGSSFRMMDQPESIPVSESRESVFDIDVYPNPTNGEFTLRVPENMSAGAYNVEVLSINGALVYSESEVVGEFKAIRLNELNPGIYIIFVSNGEHRQSKKIVINE